MAVDSRREAGILVLRGRESYQDTASLVPALKYKDDFT